MSGWAIVSIIAGVFAVLIVALLVIVSKAVMRTTRNAAALLEALEEVRSNTLVLADLEAHTQQTTRVLDDTNTALQEMHRTELGEDGRAPDQP